MAFSFDDMQNHVIDNVHLSTDFFAETITYRRGDSEELSFVADVVRSQRSSQDERGNFTTVDVIEVMFKKTELESAPKLKDRIYLADEEEEDGAYLFAYKGTSTRHTYSATFERRKVRGASRLGQREA